MSSVGSFEMNYRCLSAKNRFFGWFCIANINECDSNFSALLVHSLMGVDGKLGDKVSHDFSQCWFRLICSLLTVSLLLFILDEASCKYDVHQVYRFFGTPGILPFGCIQPSPDNKARFSLHFLKTILVN